ncbi:glycosyltransferase [Haloarcula hispanica]|uniref:Putative glycosyltransferase n=1 Tax=Haloarcula hispanica (strain ATCC 33960 / DSM 4426 / JCM 8911 / NBRC 102182 / NCIMB 2187 / VKM B-1755) TaxID=634497 RepID=G0HT63_HALHT|nr:glycosyltransferase [Haloarcula hispanica]AEM57279.1 putative glycosyltransferase [Haloarcula hispanica ATCC 33960]
MQQHPSQSHSGKQRDLSRAKLAEHVTARTPQHPIALSGITADRLAEFSPGRETIEVVPNGIEHKNVDMLLKAFDSVAADHKPRWASSVTGPSATDSKGNAGPSHADRMDIIGFLEEYENVPGHMRAAQVLVLPSMREGFGITFVEAMAADCTVVAATHPESAIEEVIDSSTRTSFSYPSK